MPHRVRSHRRPVWSLGRQGLDGGVGADERSGAAFVGRCPWLRSGRCSDRLCAGWHLAVREKVEFGADVAGGGAGCDIDGLQVAPLVLYVEPAVAGPVRALTLDVVSPRVRRSLDVEDSGQDLGGQDGVSEQVGAGDAVLAEGLAVGGEAGASTAAS